MAVKSKRIITGLTVVEEQAAIKWLEDAAVAASSESEHAIQAKNALRIIKVRKDIIKRQGSNIELENDLIKLQRNLIELQWNIIRHQDGTMKGLDDSITALADDAVLNDVEVTNG